MTRSVGDDDRRLRPLDGCLWGHAAGPEYRDLALADLHWISIVRMVDILDADLFRIAHVDRTTVNIRELLRDLRRFLCVLRRHRAHAAYKRTFKHTGFLAFDVRLVHRHVSSHGDMTHINSGL